MESANRFADEFDIPNRHAIYEALVADPSVDVVYVATPQSPPRTGCGFATTAVSSRWSLSRATSS
jgi:hypothetical protein